MIKVDEFPAKQSFVAVWLVAHRGELFSASFHYDATEDQYYTYEHGLDVFTPECDHGYSQEFFARVNATFFVTGD